MFMKPISLLKIVFCIGLFLFSTNVFAQDNIIKKDGTEVLSKVIEIGETHIKYKNFSNLNGPVYTIPISDVFMVKYENGEKDIFKETAEKTQNSIQQAPAVQNQQAATLPSGKAWSVKFGVDVAPALGVLWVHNTNAKDMAGFSFLYAVNVNIINNPSGVFFEIGAGGMLGNYSVTENRIKSEIRTNTVNFDFMLGGMSSSFYYKTGLRLGVLANAQARTGNMDFQPIDRESLSSVQVGIPFEFGGIIAKRVNIGLGWHYGFISLFEKEYTNDISITPMELYMKIGLRF